MKNEAIEICLFSKLTLKSEKLVYFLFWLFQAVRVVDRAGRIVGSSKLLGTLQLSVIVFICIRWKPKSLQKQEYLGVMKLNWCDKDHLKYLCQNLLIFKAETKRPGRKCNLVFSIEKALTLDQPCVGL